MKKTLRKLLRTNPHKPPAPAPRSAPQTRRAIWRISERAPMGEWIDPDAPPEPATPEPAAPHEATASGWMVSSMDLLNGADVSEDHETAPGALFDEVNAHRGPPKRD